MRAVLLTESGLEFRSDHPQPQPRGNEALIRVSLAGICSTDLELIKGYYAFRGVLGHEFVGVVEQSADATWIGKRVVCSINMANPSTPEFAEFGLEHHPHRTVLGIVARDGAMADYVAVPIINLLEVPPTVDDESAVFTEPLAAALRIAEQIALKPSQPVAVIGPGRLGMLVGQVMAARGANVTMLGRRDKSLELCGRLGLASQHVERAENNSFATVVDCSGCAEGLKHAIRIAQPLGTVVLKSTYAGDADINLTKVVVDEIRIVGSRCGPMAPALCMLERNQVDVRCLIDAQYAAAEALAAFNHASQPGVKKVLLNFR